MGCFLTLTQKDFAQLSTTAKASASKLGPNTSGQLKIQVSSTAYGSAKAMANEIRHQVKSARSTSASAAEQKLAVPTPEKYKHDVARLAATTELPVAICKGLVDKTISSTAGRINLASGKQGEQIAAKILEQSHNLKIHEITTSTGPDIIASRRAGNSVIVEVKTSGSGKPFADMLDSGAYKNQSQDGKGFRQCSDGWLNAVNVDPGKVDVLGVHIDPIKNTVNIYRRVDGNATTWKPIMRASLSEFNLE